jgi:hypothetical protein
LSIRNGSGQELILRSTLARATVDPGFDLDQPLIAAAGVIRTAPTVFQRSASAVLLPRDPLAWLSVASTGV